MSKTTLIHKDSVQNISYYRRDTNVPTIQAYFRVNGKTYRFSTGKTSIEEAVQVANKKHHLATQGRSTKRTSFEKALNKFLIYKESRVSPNTSKEYKRIGKYLLEYFKGRDVTSIESKSMIGLENWRRNYYKNNPDKQIQTYKRNGKIILSGRSFNYKVGNREINKTIGLCISIMRHACLVSGYITEPQIPRWKQLRENKREVFLTENDFLKLYFHFEEKNIFYADIIGFAFYTGARMPSEPNNLRWKDVHIDKKFVVLRDRKHKSKTVNSAVPLFPRTIKILERIRKRNQPKSLDEYVFVTEQGKQIKSIRKSFNSAVKECGLDERLTLYSLRHGFATHMIENYNIPLAMISRIMGHSDTQMLQKVYAHLRDDVVIKTALQAHDEAKETGRTIMNLGEDLLGVLLIPEIPDDDES